MTRTASGLRTVTILLDAGGICREASFAFFFLGTGVLYLDHQHELAVWGGVSIGGDRLDT
jgi:hypothetical protein